MRARVIYLDGTRYGTMKSAMTAAETRMGRKVAYAELSAAADKEAALRREDGWPGIRVRWDAPKDSGCQPCKPRDWKKRPLLFYQPGHTPRESWNDWRLYV